MLFQAVWLRRTFRPLAFRLHYRTSVCFTINQDLQWLVETHMAHMLIFIDRLHLIEKISIVRAIPQKWIDGHIAHSERGKVLEEVGPLGGIDAVVLQSRLHNNTCRGYL